MQKIVDLRFFSEFVELSQSSTEEIDHRNSSEVAHCVDNELFLDPEGRKSG